MGTACGPLRTTTRTNLQSLQKGDDIVLFRLGESIGERRHPVPAFINHTCYVGFVHSLAVGELIVLEQALESRAHFPLRAIRVVTDRAVVLEVGFTLGRIRSKDLPGHQESYGTQRKQ